MTCPNCKCRIFPKFGTISECVSCGYKIEKLEGWKKETIQKFMK